MFKHDFAFDPTYGYDLPRLLAITPPPAPGDFEAFWRSMYARTLNVPPRATMRKIDQHRKGRDTYIAEFDSLDGFRVGAWLTLPTDGDVRRGAVCGHGYGGRDEADYGPQFQHAAAIFPCGRGFNLSKRDDLPNNSDQHVVFGIESRDAYIHGKCAADIWAAVSALRELVPGVEPIDYLGGSFGGGIGAMAVAWEPRFRRAFLEVPSFGHHPLRLTMPCVGSGEAVRRYYQSHPRVTEVLQYFDAATAATRIRIPTLLAPALFDPCVPPPGQFAVSNAVAGVKQLFLLQAGHFDYAGGDRVAVEMVHAMDDWMSAADVSSIRFDLKPRGAIA